MTIRKTILLTWGLSLAATLPVSARQWSLQECISYAVAHNLTVKQQQNNAQYQEIQLSTSRNSRLPSLSGGANESFNFGRALTSDNTYANRNTRNTSFSLSTSAPLITGGQITQDIKIRQLNLQAALQDCEKTSEDVTLNVVSLYLEAVYQKDLVEISQRQVALSEEQVRRMQILYDNDKVSEADVAQIKQTLASDELDLTQQQNKYMLSILNLSQLMELDSPDSVEVVRPAAEDVEDIVLTSPDCIYSEALGFKPQVKAEEIRLQSARHNVKLAQSALYPSLYFNAGIGSNYYNTSGTHVESFGTQMKNNFSQYLGVSLSVPIFNRLATRNSIRAAKVQVQNQQIQLDETKKGLYKEIQQAYYNALAAQRQCVSSDAAYASAQSSFSLMQAKYENGKANATEFQQAKTALSNAETQAAQARYTFLFRQKVLDFYRGVAF